MPDDAAPTLEAVSAPALSDPERLEILSDAVRNAVAVYMNYIDPGNGVSRDDALNAFIEIFDQAKVARAAGIRSAAIVGVIDRGRRSPL